MPNFAIPGKPEYAGENMTKVASKGPWKIPDLPKRADPATAAQKSVVALAHNDSANASNSTSLAHAAPAVTFAKNDTANSTVMAKSQVMSKVQMREQLVS